MKQGDIGSSKVTKSTLEFKNILIVTKYGSDAAINIARMIVDILTKRGFKVYTVAPITLNNTISLNEDRLREEKIDLVVALGGDGTTLRAVRWFDGTIPVFSVRMKGSRGILADVSTDTIHEALDMIYNNNFYIEERVRLYASVNGINTQACVNEIMVIKSNMSVTPTYTLTIDGYEISERMDGLIIATATGSSGYSYSFGGPILHEGLDSLIVNPIAPIDRLPILVIPPIELSIRSNNPYSIYVDGQHSIDSESEIIVKRYPINAKFLRIKKRGLSHFERLR